MMNNFNNFGFPQNKNIYTDQLNNPNGIGFGNNTYMPPTKPMEYDGFYSNQSQQKMNFWDKTKAFFSQNGGNIVKWAIGGFMTLGALIGVNKFIKTDVPYGKGHELKEDASLMEKIKYHTCTFLNDAGILSDYKAKDENKTEDKDKAEGSKSTASTNPTTSGTGSGPSATGADATSADVPVEDLTTAEFYGLEEVPTSTIKPEPIDIIATFSDNTTGTVNNAGSSSYAKDSSSHSKRSSSSTSKELENKPKNLFTRIKNKFSTFGEQINKLKSNIKNKFPGFLHNDSTNDTVKDKTSSSSTSKETKNKSKNLFTKIKNKFSTFGEQINKLKSNIKNKFPGFLHNDSTNDTVKDKTSSSPTPKTTKSSSKNSTKTIKHDTLNTLNSKMAPEPPVVPEFEQPETASTKYTYKLPDAPFFVPKMDKDKVNGDESLNTNNTSSKKENNTPTDTNSHINDLHQTPQEQTSSESKFPPFPINAELQKQPKNSIIDDITEVYIMQNETFEDFDRLMKNYYSASQILENLTEEEMQNDLIGNNDGVDDDNNLPMEKNQTDEIYIYRKPTRPAPKPSVDNQNKQEAIGDDDDDIPEKPTRPVPKPSVDKHNTPEPARQASENTQEIQNTLNDTNTGNIEIQESDIVEFNDDEETILPSPSSSPTLIVLGSESGESGELDKLDKLDKPDESYESDESELYYSFEGVDNEENVEQTVQQEPHNNIPKKPEANPDKSSTAPEVKETPSSNTNSALDLDSLIGNIADEILQNVDDLNSQSPLPQMQPKNQEISTPSQTTLETPQTPQNIDIKKMNADNQSPLNIPESQMQEEKENQTTQEITQEPQNIDIKTMDAESHSNSTFNTIESQVPQSRETQETLTPSQTPQETPQTPQNIDIKTMDANDPNCINNLIGYLEKIKPNKYEQTTSDIASNKSLWSKINETDFNEYELKDIITLENVVTDCNSLNEAFINKITNQVSKLDETETNTTISLIESIDNDHLIELLQNQLNDNTIQDPDIKLAIQAKIDANKINNVSNDEKGLTSLFDDNTLTDHKSESIKEQTKYATSLFNCLKNTVLSDETKATNLLNNFMLPETTSNLILLNLIRQDDSIDSKIKELANDKYTKFIEQAETYLSDDDNGIFNHKNDPDFCEKTTNYLNMLYFDGNNQKPKNLNNFNRAIDNLNEGLYQGLSDFPINLINKISTSQNPEDIAIKKHLKRGGEGYLKALLNVKEYCSIENFNDLLLQYYDTCKVKEKDKKYLEFIKDLQNLGITQADIIKRINYASEHNFPYFIIVKSGIKNSVETALEKFKYKETTLMKKLLWLKQQEPLNELQTRYVELLKQHAQQDETLKHYINTEGTNTTIINDYIQIIRLAKGIYNSDK